MSLILAVEILVARLQRFWRWLVVPQVLMVFHHDSPGMRVYVKRNAFQRLRYNRTFSEDFEKHWAAPEAFKDLEGHAVLVALDRTRKEFDAWLEFSKRL